MVVRVVSFLPSVRDGSRFEEYCFQCLVLHKPFCARGDILQVYSSAIQAANVFFGDHDSVADLDDAVREAVIELANEVPVEASDRVLLPVSNPCPMPVRWLHYLCQHLPPPTLLLTIIIGLVNLSIASLPMPINSSGSSAKTLRCLPIHGRPILCYSTTNVWFSTG